MRIKLLAYAPLALGLALAPAMAQTATTTDPTPVAPNTTTTRNPVLGDPGSSTTRRAVRPTTRRAQAIARADKQPAGTENGNQPDRASAAGGGR